MTDFIPRTELGQRLADMAADMYGGIRALSAESGVCERTITRLIHGQVEPDRETETLLAKWFNVAAWQVNKWSRCDSDGTAYPSPRRRGGRMRAGRHWARRIRVRIGQLRLPMGV